VYRAGAALGHTASKLGAFKPDNIPDNPEQGHIVGNVELVTLAVDSEGSHIVLSFMGFASPSL
jgi:hypothetical protein